MPTLSELLPDYEALLMLEPEQLAGYLLEHLNSLPEGELRNLNRYNFFQPGMGTVAGYPPALQEKIRHALMEAGCGWSTKGSLRRRRDKMETGDSLRGGGSG